MVKSNLHFDYLSQVKGPLLCLLLFCYIIPAKTSIYSGKDLLLLSKHVYFFHWFFLPSCERSTCVSSVLQVRKLRLREVTTFSRLCELQVAQQVSLTLGTDLFFCLPRYGSKIRAKYFIILEITYFELLRFFSFFSFNVKNLKFLFWFGTSCKVEILNLWSKSKMFKLGAGKLGSVDLFLHVRFCWNTVMPIHLCNFCGCFPGPLALVE